MTKMSVEAAGQDRQDPWQADTPHLSGFSSRTLPHESHQALCSPSAGRGATGGEAGGRAATRARCAMPATGDNRGDIPEGTCLTRAQVAAAMRVSKMTVYRLVHNGELPAVRVVRSSRVTED